MVWLPDVEKSLVICLAVSTQYRRVMDRKTRCDSILRAMHMHHAHSRGKKSSWIVFTALLRDTRLNCSFQRQLGRLVTVSDLLTATSSLYRQSNYLHIDDVLLLYQAQLLGTSSLNTSETQHYPLIRLGVIVKLFCLLLI